MTIGRLDALAPNRKPALTFTPIKAAMNLAHRARPLASNPLTIALTVLKGLR